MADKMCKETENVIQCLNTDHLRSLNRSYLHRSSSITRPSRRLFNLSFDHGVAFFSVLNDSITTESKLTDTTDEIYNTSKLTEI